LKKNCLFVFLSLISWPILSQDGQPIAKANLPQIKDKSIAEEAKPAENQNKNILPLFGIVAKSAKEKADDAKFVEMCKKNFPNLKEASKFFADRGWEYISETELDTAMYRFNLCNLLDPQNVDAYWGIGVVCFQKGEYDQASKMLKMGMEIDSTNSSLIVDLATVELACYEKTNHAEDLNQSHEHLAKAIDIDPLNISAWLKRSETEYYLENYENAWDCIHSARLLDITKVDLLFVGKLSEKMKDPKNIFKF
jgi:tetratricopeptide (TPR) repeat protein